MLQFMNIFEFILILFLGLKIFHVKCQTVVKEIDLSSNWQIKNKNSSIQIENLSIPVNVYGALYNSKIIQNPFERFNDLDTRWVSNDDWIFENNFTINNSFNLKESVVNLEFDSIDTIASVYLNDHFILAARNEFLKYKIQNVNPKIKNGLNKLRIEFKSPVKYALSLSQNYPYPVPVECPPKEFNGECHVNFLRKQQSTFGSVINF